MSSSPLKYSCKIYCPKGLLLTKGNDKLFKPISENKWNLRQKKSTLSCVGEFSLQQRTSKIPGNWHGRVFFFCEIRKDQVIIGYFQGEDHSYGLSNGKKLWMELETVLLKTAGRWADVQTKPLIFTLE